MLNESGVRLSDVAGALASSVPNPSSSERRLRLEVEGGHLSVAFDQQYWLGFPGCRVASHTGRICRHAG